MRIKLRLGIIFIQLVSLLIVIGCDNKIEKDLIGTYKVYEYELKDTANNKIGYLALELKKNKSLIFYFNESKINGNWQAGDNGDMTWVNLRLLNKEIQGRVLGKNNEIIQILIPDLLIDSSCRKLSFLRSVSR